MTSSSMRHWVGVSVDDPTYHRSRVLKGRGLPIERAVDLDLEKSLKLIR